MCIVHNFNKRYVGRWLLKIKSLCTMSIVVNINFNLQIFIRKRIVASLEKNKFMSYLQILVRM